MFEIYGGQFYHLMRHGSFILNSDIETSKQKSNDVIPITIGNTIEAIYQTRRNRKICLVNYRKFVFYLLLILIKKQFSVCIYVCMSVFEISSTAHRKDKRSFALNRACLKGVQATIHGVLSPSVVPVEIFKI